jgi:hypothetical protein
MAGMRWNRATNIGSRAAPNAGQTPVLSQIVRTDRMAGTIQIAVRIARGTKAGFSLVFWTAESNAGSGGLAR